MLKSFTELRSLNIDKYLKKRDGIPYLPWAKCIDLLHENGAEEAYFVPLHNENGSSLFMSDIVFKDKNGVENRCYETHIEIHIDGKVYRMTSPVMNGANPVKDNSMSQQRVWNSMCRSFVKGVALYTGLGFNLWAGAEDTDEFLDEEGKADNFEYHDIAKIKERICMKVTRLLKEKNMTTNDVARKIGLEDDEAFRAQLLFFKILDDMERKIDAL